MVAPSMAPAPRRQQCVQEMRAPTRRLLAVTDERALARECESTEKLLRPKNVGGQSPHPLTLCDGRGFAVGVGAIGELSGELCALLALGCLSTEEEAYALELEATIVDALSQAFVSEIIDGSAACRSTRADGPADARLWLLELAVQPSPVSRQFAFETLGQVGVAATSILLTAAASSLRASARPRAVEKLEDDLFSALLEMLAKAIAVAGTASTSFRRRQAQQDELAWVQAAVECLRVFVKHTDTSLGFRLDRLGQVDSGVVRFLVETAAFSPSEASLVQEHVVEMALAAIYTPDTQFESKNAPDSAVASKDGLRISTAALDQCISLELLLSMLYTSASKHVQQLLFMAVFDLACEQLRRSKSAAAPVCKDPDLLWLALLEQDFPTRWLRAPASFSSPSIPRIAKTLATAHPSLFDKSTLAVLMQLRRLLRIDDYFDRSMGLASVIQVATNQEKGRLPDTVMRKVDELLASNTRGERFRGELWLAELLGLGIEIPCDGSRSTDTILKRIAGRHDQDSVSEALESSFCVDEIGSLRYAAQTKLWRLVGVSVSAEDRRSFACVVNLFTKRLMRSEEAAGSAVTELGVCLDVLVVRNESDKEVVTAMMALVLDVCQRAERTHSDRRRLEFDRKRLKVADGGALATRVTAQDVPNGTTKSTSTAAGVLDGSASLDADLLEAIGPAFFHHAATVLTVHRLPTHHTCHGLCCGSSRRIPSDSGVCAALILFRLCETTDTALARIGGLGSALKLLRACETRVAVLAARFLNRQAKRVNSTKYFALLRDLSASCDGGDNGGTLGNTLLHAHAILRSGMDIGAACAGR